MLINYIYIGLVIPTESLVTLICIFAVWLHMQAHVSRSVSNKILQAIQVILATFLGLSLPFQGLMYCLSLSKFHVMCALHINDTA